MLRLPLLKRKFGYIWLTNMQRTLNFFVHLVRNSYQSDGCSKAAKLTMMITMSVSQQRILCLDLLPSPCWLESSVDCSGPNTEETIKLYTPSPWRKLIFFLRKVDPALKERWCVWLKEAEKKLTRMLGSIVWCLASPTAHWRKIGVKIFWALRIAWNIQKYIKKWKWETIIGGKKKKILKKKKFWKTEVA